MNHPKLTFTPPTLPNTSEEMLLWVRDAITQLPGAGLPAFDMRHWANNGDDRELVHLDDLMGEISTYQHKHFFNEHIYAECGTTFCIAGWTVVGYLLAKGETEVTMKGEYVYREEGICRIENVANEALPHYSYENLHALFRVDYWPGDFGKRYYQATTHVELVQVARDVIDAFIADPSQFMDTTDYEQ